jgi:hypothetical protein
MIPGLCRAIVVNVSILLFVLVVMIVIPDAPGGPGKPDSTARSRLRYALQALRRELEERKAIESR